MYLIIRRPIVVFHRVTPFCPGDSLSGGPYRYEAGLEGWQRTANGTRCTSSEGERSGFDGNLLEFVTKTPSDQESGEVGADLNACANLADDGGALEDGNIVARFCETVGSREAAEATTDDDDVDRM